MKKEESGVEPDFEDEVNEEVNSETERTVCAILGERLSKARKTAGLTQAGLAKELGVTKSTLEKWEYGTREMGLESVAKASQLLKVSTDYLLGLSDSDGSLQTMSMSAKAKAILSKAREKGEEHSLLFETTFKRYMEQTAHLKALHDEIEDNGAMITKTNVKGGTNRVTNPAIKDYNSTAALINDTEKLLMKFIQDPLKDDSDQDAFDLF